MRDRRRSRIAEHRARAVACALARRAQGFNDGDVGPFSDEGQGGLQPSEAGSNDCGVHEYVISGKMGSIIVYQTAHADLPPCCLHADCLYTDWIDSFQEHRHD